MHMDQIKAAVLFRILDETVGIFRFTPMTEEQWKYWAINRQRFISLFEDNPPNIYWFYGGDFENCLLFASEDGFRVAADSTDPQDIKIIAKCNAMLQEAKLHEDIDDSNFGSFTDKSFSVMM